MCKNQLGRRNLTPEQKTYRTGKQYEAERKTVGAPLENRNAKKQFDQSGQIVSRETTRQRIAKETGTSDGFRGNQYAKVVNDQSGHLPKVVETTLISTKRTPKTN